MQPGHLQRQASEVVQPVKRGSAKLIEWPAEITEGRSSRIIERPRREKLQKLQKSSNLLDSQRRFEHDRLMEMKCSILYLRASSLNGKLPEKFVRRWGPAEGVIGPRAAEVLELPSR